MASGNGTPPYRVTILPAAAKALHALKALAVQRGLDSQFVSELLTVEAHLKRGPAAWGDPQFDYHKLGMTRFRGKTPLFYVYFSVNKTGRAVFVQGVEANPYGPLT